jgi:hypothetical protein
VQWVKQGLVFCPSGQADWMASHASHAVALPRGGDDFRIFFTCRDRTNRGHVAWLDAEITDSLRLLRVAPEPVVSPGPPGSFDDSGCTLGCLVEQGGRTFLYYMGWNLGVTVPCRNSIGLAIGNGTGPFEKYSLAPILDRSGVDPYTLSYPCILLEGGRWRMWYGSNLRWGGKQWDMDHVIKYAESVDGLHWRRDGVIALGLDRPGEYTLCRPWVVRDGGVYRMWFCHRGAAYRLGYAESADGWHWHRRPAEVGIDVSGAGWDSEMLAYPSVFRHRGRWHLLYTGNRYGRTGFGLAVAA